MSYNLDMVIIHLTLNEFTENRIIHQFYILRMIHVKLSYNLILLKYYTNKMGMYYFLDVIHLDN